jgi:Na+/H+ antiporter NhaD/arsenite permease-like protein
VDALVLVVFAAVYGGMILGELPGLALDRTGIALLGAIALVVTGRSTPEAAWSSVDVATLALLFGLMVVSAQLRLGGFYSFVTRFLAQRVVPPRAFLAWLVLVAGLLSALLANDIICLAMSPLLVEGCARRRLDPVPFLLALAAASNVGSAATLIGNPQNMLIGQTMSLSFLGYLGAALVPSVLGLGVVWLVVAFQTGDRWELDFDVPPVAAKPLDRWQTGKALVVLGLLACAFLLTSLPRDVLALGAAGLLLTSRSTTSRDLIGLVDWQLLLLFIGLFVVNDTLRASGTLASLMSGLASIGIDPSRPGTLFVLTAVLSNLVSNVPAVMLLLPYARGAGAAGGGGGGGGAILALASTLAGNLFVVGSIANIIVIAQARRLGIEIGWRRHARVGVPVTLATLAIAWLWLWLWLYFSRSPPS